MKVYISGPITGTDDYMMRFKEAEKKLKEEGMKVVNPATVNAMLPEDTSYEEYMEMSLCMLQMCDAIYLLKDWENSKGANREYGYALGRGKTIMYE